MKVPKIFRSVTPEEVNDIITDLGENKANNSYDIAPKLIKIIRMTIPKLFALIANSSFYLGVFPDKLKFAKVTPIHTGKSKLKLGNYTGQQIFTLLII